MRKVNLVSFFVVLTLFFSVAFLFGSSPKSLQSSAVSSSSQTATETTSRDFQEVVLWEGNRSSSLSAILLGLKSFTFTDNGLEKKYDFQKNVFSKLRRQIFKRYWRIWWLIERENLNVKDLTFWNLNLDSSSEGWLNTPLGSFLRTLVDKQNIDPLILQQWQQQQTLRQEKFLNNIRDLLMQFQWVGANSYFDEVIKETDFSLDFSNVSNLATVKFAQLSPLQQAQLERLFFFAGDITKVKQILKATIWQAFHEEFGGDLLLIKKFDIEKLFAQNADYPLLNRFVNVLSSQPTDENWTFDLSLEELKTIYETGYKLRKNVFNEKLVEYRKKIDYGLFVLNLHRYTRADIRYALGFYRKSIKITELIKLPNIFLPADQLTGRARRQLTDLFVNRANSFHMVYELPFEAKTNHLKYIWKNAAAARKERTWNSFRDLFLEWRDLVVEHKVKPVHVPSFMAEISNLETVKFANLDVRVQNWFTTLINYAGDGHHIKTLLNNEILYLFSQAIRSSVRLTSRKSISVLPIKMETGEVYVWEEGSVKQCSWWEFWCQEPKFLVKKKVYLEKKFRVRGLRTDLFLEIPYNERLGEDAWKELNALRDAGVTTTQFKDAVNSAPSQRKPSRWS